MAQQPQSDWDTAEVVRPADWDTAEVIRPAVTPARVQSPAGADRVDPRVGPPPPPPRRVPLNPANVNQSFGVVGSELAPMAASLQEGAKPENLRQAARVALPAIGGTVAALTGPPGWVAGTLAAAAGAGAGSAASVGLDTATGAPPTLKEAAQRVAVDAATGAAGEGIGRGAVHVGRRVLAPFAKALTDEGRRAYDYLGGHVTPGQVSESGLLKLIDNVMAGSIFGGAQSRAFAKETVGILDDKVKRIVAEHAPLGGGPAQTLEGAGDIWQSLQAAARGAERDIGKHLYQRVDQIAEATNGLRVSLKPLTEFADAETARAGQLGLSLRGGPGPRTLRQVQAAGEAIDDSSVNRAASEYIQSGVAGGNRQQPEFIEALRAAGINPSAIDDGVTFSEAQEIRSVLGEMIDKAKRSTDSSAATTKRIASALKDRMDQAITTAAGGPNTPLRTALDAADAQWFKLKETFDRGILAEVAKTRPSLVVNKLIKPHTVKDIEKARETIGAAGWNDVKATFLAEKLLKGRRGEGVTGAELLERMIGKSGYGDETIRAVFPAGTADEIYKFARVLATIEKKGDGSGGIYIKLAQGGAIGGLVLGKQAGKAATILLTPLMLSRLMLKPRTIRWLTVGLKAPPGSKEAVEAAAQLTMFLNQERLIDTAQAIPPTLESIGRTAGRIGAMVTGGRGQGPAPAAPVDAPAYQGPAPLTLPAPRPLTVPRIDPTQPPPPPPR